jgi:hypothetical protein
MFSRKKPRDSRILLLDGPLRPNDLLDRADTRALPDPDDLCVTADGALLISSGARLLRLRDWRDDVRELAEFDHPISALATRNDGLIAVGLRGDGIRVLASDGTALPGWASPTDARNIRACAFLRDGALLVANACTGEDENADIRDLFAKIGTGHILRLTEDGGCRTIADRLRYPHGLIETATGDLFVAESWAARVGAPNGDNVMENTPGYPARIAATSDGGYILSLFARRDPLIEFVRNEPEFLARMTAEIDPAYWIAPRLGVDRDYRLPTQMGATRLFGDIKPWAPSFSYGLVVRLDAAFTPVASAHSRANGVRHGITSAVEWNGALIAVSKGAGALLKVTEMDQWT